MRYAPGADYFGLLWAITNGITVKKFPADWNQYGRSAGFLRNIEMAKYANALVVFPGGKGTEHMMQQADKYGLTIYKELRSQRLIMHRDDNV